MEFARINRDAIVNMYSDGKSTYEIAKALNTYSTKISRALKFLGIERRDYSEAQAIALKTGRSKHPTQGKTLDNEHKSKIGKSVTEKWRNMTDEEKEQISNINKARWDAMTDEERDSLRNAAIEAVRSASRNGSKAEKHLRNALSSAGYTVEFHKSDIVDGTKYELDIFLPEIKTAVEIDGPSHFMPIWGEEKLRKQIQADIIKQGILLSRGYAVIRILQKDKNSSLTKMNELSKIVLEEVDRIKNDFPPENQRLIEIEVLNGRTRRI